MPPKRKRATETEEASSTARAKRPTKSAKTSPEYEELNAKKSKAPAVIAQTPEEMAMYSEHRFQTFFQTYADPDDPKVMGTDGIQQLFEEADLSLESTPPFLLAWICKSADFGAFRIEEWQKLRELQIDTPQRLKAAITDLEQLFYSGVPIPDDGGASGYAKVPSRTKKAPGAGDSSPTGYYREPLRRATSNPQKAFREFYVFCFGLMKKAEARVMEMELATAAWSVVLQPKYPIIEKLLEFITEHPSYKAVNKDLWSMTLEFCITLDDRSIADWNDEESWPTMLDDFVAWEKKRIQTDSQGDVKMS